MKTSTSMTFASCLLVAAAAITTARADSAAKKATKGKMAKHAAVFVTPDDIRWTAAPPDLPKDAQMAVLFGDPSKHDVFTVRLKVPDGYKIAPHWHSQDEQLTIIDGTLRLYMGDTMSGEPHELTRGSFHFLPAKEHHAAEARGATIVQINGTGPFDIHYLNAEDNPNRAAKSARR